MRRLLTLAALFLPACAAFPPQPPTLRIAPDNHTVAFLGPSARILPKLTLIDLPSTRTSAHYLPCDAEDFRWLPDNRILLAGVNTSCTFSPVTSRFTRPVQNFEEAEQVVHLEDFFTLRSNAPAGATLITSDGQTSFWGSDPHDPRVLHWIAADSVDLLAPDQRLVTHISVAQLSVLGMQSGPFDASVSPDHHALMLAPVHTPLIALSAWSPESIWPWYSPPPIICSLPNATLLFTIPRTPAIVSPATLRDDGLYAITETTAPDPPPPQGYQHFTHTFHLTRFTKAGPENLRELPLTHSPYPFAQTFSAAFSPDKTLLVIYSITDPHHPTLLQIPLPAPPSAPN